MEKYIWNEKHEARGMTMGKWMCRAIIYNTLCYSPSGWFFFFIFDSVEKQSTEPFVNPVLCEGEKYIHRRFCSYDLRGCGVRNVVNKSGMTWWYNIHFQIWKFIRTVIFPHDSNCHMTTLFVSKSSPCVTLINIMILNSL